MSKADVTLFYLVGSVFLSGGLGAYLHDGSVGAMCFGACLIVGTLFTMIVWGAK